MDKTFDPASYESKWQRAWDERGYFTATAPSEREPWCVMIPPPNVTGKLHMGHALQSTLQDLLVRWQRMRGKEALWLPGTDHAGIATQLMVERAIEQEGSSRRELGREKFLERVWEWKEQYQDNIRSQLEKLGASCDWTRERFTLDESMSRAVTEAFVRCWEKGLITRDRYMVNWSPALQTAISDLEVEMKEVDGRLYHLAYPIAGSDDHLIVATTRPETMLGDTAVARNPDDRRYLELAEARAVLPLVGRELPIVADAVVDPDFGSGLVKITPFHDFNDFELASRHGLDGVQVIDERGHMTAATGEDYAGLDRFEARRKVVEDLERVGALVKVEEHTHNVGHCQRSGVPVEPMVSEQWFMDVSVMANRALEAWKEGELKLIPATWGATWKHWLENIRPWCISRQLWWGHRIPAWYTPDGECIVARSEEEACAAAGRKDLTRDPDVLDTWFSSGLWPMSTLGWPEETDDFRTFYPTQTLVTGFDILFFWVARMVMFGFEFTDQTPFADVHLTGLVRDAEGRKMSKTRGNTVDPLDLVDEYGADALRFTLAILDSPGSDIPLDRDRIAGYRAFGNKIWNATRFALSKVEAGNHEIAVEDLQAPERWILSRSSRVAEAVGSRLEDYRFDEACRELYSFFWGELCDWYIEMAKPVLHGDVERPAVGDVLLSVLDRSLRLLHPVMPHLTEELWQRLPGVHEQHGETIVRAAYPQSVPEWEDVELEQQMAALIEVVTRVRSIRAESKVPPRETVQLRLDGDDTARMGFLQQQQDLIARAARAEVAFAPTAGADVVDRVARVDLGVVVPERRLADAEIKALAKERDKLAGQIESTRRQLADEGFLSKAPEQVVAKRRSRLDEMQKRVEAIEANLADAG